MTFVFEPYFEVCVQEDIKVTESDVRDAIDNDHDFVALPRFDCSLVKFLDRYPDGAPNSAMICKALALSEAEVERLYGQALKSLREAFR